GRENLEAEDAGAKRFLNPRRRQGAVALLLQRPVNRFGDFDQVGTGSRGRVKDIHLIVGQPVGNAQLAAQELIDSANHVLDNFWRRVPNAQLLAQLRIESLKKRLV